jgi:hypothetical protein
MVQPDRLLARDFASMLLDIVPDAPCHDDTFACTLRTLVDYMVPATLVLAACVALGFLLAISVSVLLARVERAGAPRRRRKRILSEPIHTDGVWVRLVEDEQGRRMVEVLEGVNWRPTTRDLAQFNVDARVTTGPHS